MSQTGTNYGSGVQAALLTSRPHVVDIDDRRRRWWLFRQACVVCCCEELACAERMSEGARPGMWWRQCSECRGMNSQVVDVILQDVNLIDIAAWLAEPV